MNYFCKLLVLCLSTCIHADKYYLRNLGTSQYLTVTDGTTLGISPTASNSANFKWDAELSMLRPGAPGKLVRLRDQIEDPLEIAPFVQGVDILGTRFKWTLNSFNVDSVIFYQIQSNHTGGCIAVNASLSLNLEACNNIASSRQLWRFILPNSSNDASNVRTSLLTDDYVKILGKSDGLALLVSTDMLDGASVGLATFTNRDEFIWKPQNNRLMSANSEKYLGWSGTGANMSRLFAESSAQSWVLAKPAGSEWLNSYIIQHSSGGCLTASNIYVYVSPCSGADNQVWYLLQPSSSASPTSTPTPTSPVSPSSFSESPAFYALLGGSIILLSGGSVVLWRILANKKQDRLTNTLKAAPQTNVGFGPAHGQPPSPQTPASGGLLSHIRPDLETPGQTKSIPPAHKMMAQMSFLAHAGVAASAMTFGNLVPINPNVSGRRVSISLSGPNAHSVTGPANDDEATNDELQKSVHTPIQIALAQRGSPTVPISVMPGALENMARRASIAPGAPQGRNSGFSCAPPLNGVNLGLSQSKTVSAVMGGRRSSVAIGGNQYVVTAQPSSTAHGGNSGNQGHLQTFQFGGGSANVVISANISASNNSNTTPIPSVDPHSDTSLSLNIGLNQLNLVNRLSSNSPSASSSSGQSSGPVNEDGDNLGKIKHLSAIQASSDELNSGLEKKRKEEVVDTPILPIPAMEPNLSIKAEEAYVAAAARADEQKPAAPKRSSVVLPAWLKAKSAPPPPPALKPAIALTPASPPPSVARKPSVAVSMAPRAVTVNVTQNFHAGTQEPIKKLHATPTPLAVIRPGGGAPGGAVSNGLAMPQALTARRSSISPSIFALQNGLVSNMKMDAVEDASGSTDTI